MSVAKEHPVLTVEDDGIGIPVDDQARIFERFYRVDKSHSRQIGGTGLGLSIVKHGAIYHKAKVELKSALGEGTTVRIVFWNCNLFLPPSGCAAWQHQTGFGDRKPDFLGIYVASEFRNDLGAHHVGEDCRSQAGGVGVDEEEERVIG